MLAVLVSLAGYPANTAWQADTDDLEMTDEQAVQALRDLGLPPGTVLDMVRRELRESIRNGTNSIPDLEKQETTDGNGADPQAIAGSSPVSQAVVTDSSSPSTGNATEMTDEQAVQALRDLGLPPKTILSMIRKELCEAIRSRTDSAPDSTNQTATGNSGATPQAIAQSPQASQTIVIDSSSPITVVTAPSVRTIDDFRDALAPHGVWVRVEPYGLVWQPTVTMINTSWRPYFQDGSWEWTDDGWCWRSRYSWGWATFHYGRWVYVTRHRWLWIPDTVWAPSWVQWRYSDSYVGWAPLPPEACYDRSMGFSYRGSHVSIDFDFGLTDWHYSFVPAAGFMEREPCRVGIPRRDIRKIYSDSVTVRHSHTTKSNVTLPALPREIVSNAGRRTENLRRIVSHDPAESATAGSWVRTPSAAPATTTVFYSSRSDAGRNEPATITRASRQSSPSTVRSYVAPQPAVATAPDSRPQTSSDRRTTALRDIVSRSVQNSIRPAGDNPAPAQHKPRKDIRSVSPAASAASPRNVAEQSDPPQIASSSKQTTPSQVQRRAAPQPAVVAIPDSQPQTSAERRTASLRDIVSRSAQSITPPTGTAPATVRRSPQPGAQSKPASDEGSIKGTDVLRPSGADVRDSETSNRNGSRISRLQSLLRDKQERD